MTDTTQIPPAAAPQPSIVRLIVTRLDRRTMLALLAILALVLLTLLLIFHDPPDKARDMVNMMIGALIILTKDAYAYDFNTTGSSASKDDTIKQSVLANLPQTPAVTQTALSTETKGP